MSFPDDVQAAVTRLLDALCSHERATTVESVLILRMADGAEVRALSGKPCDLPDVSDRALLSSLKAGAQPEVANELLTHSRKCPKWGALVAPGEKHVDCPVTYENVVCACECTTCKRAWWDAGRPKTGPVAK